MWRAATARHERQGSGPIDVISIFTRKGNNALFSAQRRLRLPLDGALVLDNTAHLDTEIPETLAIRNRVRFPDLVQLKQLVTVFQLDGADDILASLNPGKVRIQDGTIPLDVAPVLRGDHLADEVSAAVGAFDEAGVLAVELAGCEVALVLLEQLAGALLPGLVAFRHVLLDDGETVLGQGLGGLAVQRVLGDLLELVEGVVVEVQQGGARRRVGAEAGEAGRGAGLEKAGGRADGTRRGREQSECRSHGFRVVRFSC